MAKAGFRLALLATLLALVVVLLGAYTRLTHAGLGCPDWPGCYGFISVPQSEAQLAHAELHFPDAPVQADKGWSEMVHRYFAGTLGLLILLLAARAWSQRRLQDQPLKLPLFILLVVIAQAAFGMWTVTLKLWPQVVTGHLLGGFATLSLLFLLTLRLSGVLPALAIPRRLQRWATAGLGFTVLPMMYCEQELQDGQLVQLLPKWTLPGGWLHAVYPHRRGVIPAVRAWIDHLVESFESCGDKLL